MARVLAGFGELGTLEWWHVRVPLLLSVPNWNLHRRSILDIADLVERRLPLLTSRHARLLVVTPSKFGFETDDDRRERAKRERVAAVAVAEPHMALVGEIFGDWVTVTWKREGDPPTPHQSSPTGWWLRLGTNLGSSMSVEFRAPGEVAEIHVSVNGNGSAGDVRRGFMEDAPVLAEALHRHIGMPVTVDVTGTYRDTHQRFG